MWLNTTPSLIDFFGNRVEIEVMNLTFPSILVGWLTYLLFITGGYAIECRKSKLAAHQTNLQCNFIKMCILNHHQSYECLQGCRT